MGHHKKKKKHKSKHKRRSSSSSDSPYEPPKKQKVIGPSLPTVFPISTVPAPAVASTSSQIDSYGPQLPPHLNGPQLPPHLIKPKVNVEETLCSKPVQEDDGVDVSNIIGPLPADLQSSSRVQQALDERAEMLKYEFLLKGTGDDITQRETWMTELPSEKAKYCGLEARKFRTTTNFGDPKNRALWTETPLDKNKSQQQDPVEDMNTFQELVVEQRNKIMDQIVKKNEEKKEKKSLLEIHREKLKKKNKEKSKDGKQERRPFDRDVDLEVNKFDEAQKKSMLKRAQLLDDKFAHGKSKYL